MTVLAEPKLMSFDDFMAMPDSVGYELIEGVLTERKPMGALSDFVAIQIATELNLFCRQTGAGHVFGSETTYRCFTDPETGRRADVSFIRRGRLPGERIPGGYIGIPADVMVEVVSPNDAAYKVMEKVALYLRSGFEEIWVVFPNVRSVHVYRRGAPLLNFQGDETLTGRGPLEGFSCPLSRLFPLPETAEPETAGPEADEDDE